MEMQNKIKSVSVHHNGGNSSFSLTTIQPLSYNKISLTIISSTPDK